MFATLSLFFFFVYLGILLSETHGHYRADDVLGFFLLWILFLAAYYRTLIKGLSLKWRGDVVAGSILCFSLTPILPSHWPIIYTVSSVWVPWLSISLQVIFFFSCILFLLCLLENVPGIIREKMKPLWDGAIMGIGGILVILQFLNRYFVLKVSPSPLIDVFTTGTAAADYLLTGINPYVGHYVDIYNGVFDYPPGHYYLPAVPIIQAISRLLFGDIRALYLVCDGLTLFGIFRIARHYDFSKKITVLVLSLWLSFPVSLFVLEQAWNDTYLIAFTSLMIAFLLEKRWVLSGVLLGLLCSTKQYVILLGILSAFHVWKTAGLKASVKYLTTSIAVAIPIILPFVIWDSEAFYRGVFAFALNLTTRLDAFTMRAWLENNHYAINETIFKFLPFAGLFGSLVFLAKKWNPSQSFRQLLWALVMSYGGFFLFARQAFCNYYYYFSFFVLLSLLATSEKLQQKSAI